MADKKPIRERIADAAEFSKDIILDTFILRTVGNGDISIENYKGILEYSDTRIRIRAKPVSIKICGKGLEIKTITDEALFITGSISSLGFSED